MSGQLPILYGSRESGHAYKAKLALSLLGIPHEYRDVDLRVPFAERRGDFRHVSPYGEVPVWVDGSLRLAQSNAILIHLARQTSRLGARDIDLVTQWLFWEANRIGFSVPNLRHALVLRNAASWTSRLAPICSGQSKPISTSQCGRTSRSGSTEFASYRVGRLRMSL